MKRINLTSPSNTPNFIGCWMMEPNICSELINYFENNISKQKKGVISGGMNKESKNSIDLSMSPKELLLPENECFNTYFEKLFEFYKDYACQWPFLKEFANQLHIDRFNIQRYQINQHFQKVHTERCCMENIHRLFAWMTYLNDVPPEDGGSTIFTHYGLQVQPKKGLTMIWPAEWTHAHKGSVLNNNSKYIITGWMHFAS